MLPQGKKNLGIKEKNSEFLNMCTSTFNVVLFKNRRALCFEKESAAVPRQ